MGAFSEFTSRELIYTRHKKYKTIFSCADILWLLWVPAFCKQTGPDSFPENVVWPDLVLLLKSPVKNLIISSEPSEKQSFPVGKSLWTVSAWLGLDWSVTNPVKSCYLYQPRLPPQKLFQRWISELRQIPWKMFDCHRKIWKPATCESRTNQMTIHDSITFTNIWSMKVSDYWTVSDHHVYLFSFFTISPSVFIKDINQYKQSTEPKFCNKNIDTKWA